MPHESLGQQLVLVIEGNASQSSIAQLQEICKKNLGKYEQPRQIFFLPEIPKTAMGNLTEILKFLLNKIFP
jgi:o-succinylbenzoate---CoA ligase